MAEQRERKETARPPHKVFKQYMPAAPKCGEFLRSNSPFDLSRAGKRRGCRLEDSLLSIHNGSTHVLQFTPTKATNRQTSQESSTCLMNAAA